MDNGSITGKTYPASLAEAYEVIRLWAIPTQKKATTTSLVLVANEDSSKAKVVGGRGGRGTGGGRGAGGRGGRGLAKNRKGARHLS